MAKLPTKDEVFGARPAPRSNRQILSYDGGVEARAAQDAAIALQNQGKQLGVLAERETVLRAAGAESEAEKKVMEYLYDPQKGILNLKGGNALGVSNKTKEWAQTFKEGQLASIQDPRVRGRVASRLDAITTKAIEASMRHESAEQIGYASTLSQARVTNAQNAVGLQYNDEELYQQALKEAETGAMSDAKLNGILDQTAVAAEVRAAKSKVLSSRITGALNSGIPSQILQADKWLKAAMADGTADFPDVVKLKGVLDQAVPKAAAKEAYDHVLSGGDAIALAAATAQNKGINPVFAAKVFKIEAGGNPLAKNPKSTAEGPYQFLDATGKQYGLVTREDKIDVTKSTEAFAAYTKDNMKVLEKALGRPPSEGELYLAHQQGATGASKLLANPMRTAASIVGMDAVINNGGRADMSAGEFANLWINKYDNLKVGSLTPVIDPGTVNAQAEELEKLYPGAGAELQTMVGKYQDAQAADKKLKTTELTDKLQKQINDAGGDYSVVSADDRALAADLGVDYTKLATVASDPAVVLDLDAMTSSQLASINLDDKKYLQSLTFEDRQKYKAKQGELAKPDNKFTEEMIESVAGYYYGVKNPDADMSKQENKTGLAAMKNFISYQANMMREAGKQVTKKDINGFAASYIQAQKDRGWFTQLIDPTGQLFGDVGRPLADYTLDDIPEGTRLHIEASLQAADITLSDTAVLTSFLQYKNKGWVDSSGELVEGN